MGHVGGTRMMLTRTIALPQAELSWPAGGVQRFLSVASDLKQSLNDFLISPNIRKYFS